MRSLDERLEQAGAQVRRYVAAGPLPPIRERGGRRRAAVAVALGIVALAALATPLVFLGRGRLADAGPIPTSEPDLILWLSPGVSEELLGRAAAQAMAWEGVVYAAPFDRGMALDEFREEFADQPSLVLIVEGDPSVLPQSIRLWLDASVAPLDVAESAGLRLADIGVAVAQITVLDDIPPGPSTTLAADTTALSTTTIPVAATPRLGVGHVWPEEPLDATPADLAHAFAVEVLGWADASVTPDLQADPDGPVWVGIRQPGLPELRVLTAPSSGVGRVLMQVGLPPATGAMEPLDDSPGTQVGLQRLVGAASADVTVRVAGREGPLVFFAGSDEVRRGFVETIEIPDAQDIQAVLVRYRDGDGKVISAAGGHY